MKTEKEIRKEIEILRDMLCIKRSKTERLIIETQLETLLEVIGELE